MQMYVWLAWYQYKVNSCHSHDAWTYIII